MRAGVRGNGFEGQRRTDRPGQEVIDQSHLHGLLHRLGDFGLELLIIEALSDREENNL